MFNNNSKILKKNLSNKTVLIDEIKITNYSDNYLTLEKIPEQFGLGKNLIKFKANNFNLLPNSTIEFECCDANNQPIYVESLKTKSHFSRFISVNVDDSNSTGQGYLIVVFKAKNYPNGVLIDPNINSNYEYNVRYKYPIYVNKNFINESEIYFDEDPILEIKEIIAPSYKSYPEDILTKQLTGSLYYNLSINNVPYVTTEFDLNDEILNNGFLNINQITGSYLSKYTFNSSSIKIKNILNKRNLVLDTPLELSGSNDKFKIKEFTSSNFNLSHQSYKNIEQPISQSYLNVNLSNLNKSTGKINKFNLYVNVNSNTGDDYKLVTTQEIKNSNIFIDKNSSKLNNSLGYIYTQSFINNYYDVTGFNSTPTSSIIYNNDVLYNSLSLNHTSLQATNSYFEVKIKDTNSLDFNDSVYELEFDLIGKKDINHPGNPNLLIMLSGSSFKNNSNDHSGFVISEIKQKEDFKNYGRLNYKFQTKKGSGILKFIFKSGNFYIRDIEIKGEQKNGYTPNSTILNIPLNINSRFDDLDFRFEFQNSKGDTSPQIYKKKLYNFTGSNNYISGDDNQVYGKINLSNNPDKGLEVGGDRTGGYIRSKGIYSNTGSLNPSGSGLIMFDFLSGSRNDVTFQDSTIDNNVGFDLYADNGEYLRFRAYGPDAGLRLNSADITGGPAITPGLNFLEMPFTKDTVNQNSTVALTNGSYVHRVQVYKNEVFDGTTPEILVRVLGATPLTIMGVADSDLTSLGNDVSLDVTPVGPTNAGVVNIALSSGGSTTGNGFVYIYYSTDKIV